MISSESRLRAWSLRTSEAAVVRRSPALTYIPMVASIQQASASDVPSLVKLMREFHAESRYLLDEDRAAKSFQKLLADSRLGRVWIFVADSIAVGYVVMTMRFCMEYGGLVAFIDDLYVIPTHRREGVGRRGLEELFVECGRRGIVAVQVEVGAENIAARALYAVFGLQPHTDGREVLSVELPSPGASTGV